MTTRATLHGIVDELPEDLLPVAELSLTRLADFDDEFWAALVTRSKATAAAGKSAKNTGGEATILALRELSMDWDGDDSRPPTAREIETALSFWRALPEVDEAPSIGPANDGGVVFEWEVGSASLYCYARESTVEVAAFDSERDIVELELPPTGAAVLTTVLLNALTKAQ